MLVRFFSFCLLVACFPIYTITAQPLLYTTANAHSHNDYEQPRPFTQAYDEQFGSIEADIFLVNRKLLVGHNPRDLTPARTLEQLYLLPLKAMVEKNHGYPYADKTRRLQLLIDVKSDSVKTLDALVTLLKHYHSIRTNHFIKIVVTGNRPGPEHYRDYPAFIWFDGRLNQQYTSSALARIALLSDNLNNYIKWKGEAPMDIEEHNKILSLVKKSHELKKPVRFWAIPDNRVGWREMEKLQVDYLNTDHIENLADFLSLENDSLQLLPFNRSIRSAGKVIRFGNPELQNHALDAAALGNSSVVIEDRYGIAAMAPIKNKILQRWSLLDDPKYQGYMSTSIQASKYLSKTVATGCDWYDEVSNNKIKIFFDGYSVLHLF